ncbi:MAG: ABC transporter permease [Nitrospirae bacterium GWC2_57_13]|jgi:phospholipid/cholesterol/gamma-HCH transport system permease protein|nr:MAG: ABC transporter permease [Nitrospirae bacterium GWC2_57_13]HAS54879.1 ABC transporter permease [Nitrospiraceae bacterium]
MNSWLERFGKWALLSLAEIGKVLIFFSETLRLSVSRPFYLKNVLKQMEQIGVNSIPVVLTTAISTGMVLALQSYTGFKRFGAESLIGAVVSLSMTRELGPVLTGLMVAGRAGASMAAELGTMKVTEQIDAMATLATNPMKYLVVPRFIASTIMMFFLTALGMMIGITGGYFVGVKVLGTNPVTYINQSINNTQVSDIWYGLIKALVFGAVIGLIGCYKGFNTEGGAEGVGKATTGAVVVSCMLILILDYFLSALLW